MAETVIKIDDLSKEYRLGVIGHGTLYRDLQSWWARIRGKEDPNSEVFDHERKHGDRFMALRNISFEVKAGERLGIIGRNGAGKSTLLKILSRVTTPSSGNVRIKGRVASLLEVGTGFHPELTGRENIYLNGAILGMNRAEVAAKFDEIVDFAGVADFVDTPVKRYSSGMYVRLAFAVAAHLEPDILIVDEVLAVGDAEFQRKCLGKMEDVSKNQGRTVLFVSHSMSSVKKLCDRAILLDGGEVEASGDVSDIVEIYLSGGKARAESGAGPIYFAPREDLAMQILSVALVDETGQPRDKFVVGESPVLQIEYEVRQPIDGMAIQFQLMRNGDAVLTQADNESPASDDIRPPGKYRVRVQMPDFLNAGKFVFSAIQTNRLRKTATNHSVRLDQKEAMLHFEIREAEEQRRIISHALEAGPVVSDQSWQTKLLLRSKNTPDSSGSAIL